METVTEFIFMGSKITADGEYSHEINTCLPLGRKTMTNLESISKSRDIILPTKVRLVTAMVLPVLMYGCENWTIKKAEHQRIDAFELWCWRRLLRVPWTARRTCVLKIYNKESNYHHTLPVNRTKGTRKECLLCLMFHVEQISVFNQIPLFITFN